MPDVQAPQHKKNTPLTSQAQCENLFHFFFSFNFFLCFILSHREKYCAMSVIKFKLKILLSKLKVTLVLFSFILLFPPLGCSSN